MARPGCSRARSCSRACTAEWSRARSCSPACITECSRGPSGPPHVSEVQRWYARAFAYVVRALVLTACVASGTAHAQVERGEIRLVVTDQTGLAIGATGTLASEAPQLLRQFSIDES